jgi:hypothetical protein
LKNNGVNPVKECQPRNWQGSFSVAMSLFGVICSTHAPGYLAVIGPAPLRFAPVPVVVTNKLVVLPAPAPAPAPVEAAPPPEKPVSRVVVPATPATDHSAVIMEATSGTPQTQPQPPINTASPEAVVSPEMLLKFFKPSNGMVLPNTPGDSAPPGAGAAQPPAPAKFQSNP